MLNCRDVLSCCKSSSFEFTAGSCTRRVSRPDEPRVDIQPVGMLRECGGAF